MEGASSCTLGSQAQHRPHSLDYIYNRAPPLPTLNNFITFNNKITTTPKNIAKQLTNTVRYATHKTNIIHPIRQS